MKAHLHKLCIRNGCHHEEVPDYRKRCNHQKSTWEFLETLYRSYVRLPKTPNHHTLTLMMASAMFSKMLVNTQHSVWLTPKSWSYTINCNHKKQRTRITFQITWTGTVYFKLFSWNVSSIARVCAKVIGIIKILQKGLWFRTSMSLLLKWRQFVQCNAFWISRQSSPNWDLHRDLSI